MIQSRFRHALLFIVTLALSLTYAYAIDVTARIKGTVTDPSGAVIAKAQVTVTNVNTGVVSTTTTNDSGDYILPSLPIGTYKINVAAPGFKQFTATGITLNIDQEFVETVKLTLGSNADTVSVEADAVQVNTTDMQLNNIVDSHQIVELPLIGRAFTQLEQILPGVQASSDRFGSFSVNGSQTQQSAYVINGADSNDLPLNTIAIQPNIDALAQFNLVTGPLNAEYDRNGGAIVNTAIKQGTNHFHGDVFEFYRDTFLNTRNYFQKLSPRLRPTTRTSLAEPSAAQSFATNSSSSAPIRVSVRSSPNPVETSTPSPLRKHLVTSRARWFLSLQTVVPLRFRRIRFLQRSISRGASRDRVQMRTPSKAASHASTAYYRDPQSIRLRPLS